MCPSSSAAPRQCCGIRAGAEIADCLGFNDAIDQTGVSDLVIIGAGPAGLAAAVYGASEGRADAYPAARLDRRHYCAVDGTPLATERDATKATRPVA